MTQLPWVQQGDEQFQHQFTYSNLAEAQTLLQTMNPEVRHLFPYVEVLVRLLLLSQLLHAPQSVHLAL